MVIEFVNRYKYIRNYWIADIKYNWWSVDFNWSWSNKYIRVYTGFKPSKISIIASWQSPTSQASFWWSVLWTSNTCFSTVITASVPSVYVYYANNSFIFSYANAAETYSWIVNILENWFEIYYSKSWTTATTSWNMVIDVE